MFLHCRLYDGLRRNILAKIQHIIAVVFQKDLDDIFSNIMNISLYRCQDDGPLLLLLLSAGIHLLFDYLKGALCCLCAHQKLRQEHGSLLKALSDHIQCRDDLAVDHIQCVLNRQQFLCRMHSLILQSFHNTGMQV